MDEYLSFRRFITPMIIQVIFWVAVVVVVIGGLVTMFSTTFFGGLVILILGPIAVRIECELLILMFRMHEELVAIRTGRPPEETRAFPVIPIAATADVPPASAT